ncbi:MAG TPA: transaldolase [Bdellovibrionota bacterium]|nr:transaldolase [Bdellovibrionota bacterium]
MKVEIKRVKIFTDGANLDEMVALAKRPEISGLTTNPTLMQKSGVKDYREFCRKVLSEIKSKPISFEVIADDFAGMRKQAQELASWGENVYVKIPVMNTQGEASYGLIRELAGMRIKQNVTAVFDLEQVRSVAEALKGGPASVISVFAGRIADTGRDPVPHMRQALAICRAADPSIELLWASPREVLNVVQADEIGCDIITVTPDISKKLAFLNKDLREFSRETVEMFKNDAEKAGFQL